MVVGVVAVGTDVVAVAVAAVVEVVVGAVDDVAAVVAIVAVVAVAVAVVGGDCAFGFSVFFLSCRSSCCATDFAKRTYAQNSYSNIIRV